MVGNSRTRDRAWPRLRAALTISKMYDQTSPHLTAALTPARMGADVHVQEWATVEFVMIQLSSCGCVDWNSDACVKVRQRLAAVLTVHMGTVVLNVTMFKCEL